MAVFVCVLLIGIQINYSFAQFSPSLATIFDGDKNVSCPGKSITVKCSVRGVSLQWSIGRSSIDISGSRTVTFVAGPNEENNRDIITTNIGDMVFYQNTTFVDVSNPSNSSIESELRFYIYNTKDFVEVICSDSSTNSMQKNITVLGFPPPPKQLKSTHDSKENLISYHLITWSMENDNDFSYFILNDSISNSFKIPPHWSRFNYGKEANRFMNISIVTMNQCGDMSERAEELVIRPYQEYPASSSSKVSTTWIVFSGYTGFWVLIVIAICGLLLYMCIHFNTYRRFEDDVVVSVKMTDKGLYVKSSISNSKRNYKSNIKKRISILPSNESNGTYQNSDAKTAESYPKDNGSSPNLPSDCVDFVMMNADHGLLTIKKDKIKEVMKQQVSVSC